MRTELGISEVHCVYLCIDWACAEWNAQRWNGDTCSALSGQDICFMCRVFSLQAWYLYALFELFLLLPIVECIFGKVNRIWIMLLLTAMALLLYPHSDCLAYVTGYAYIFYMGVYIRKTGLLDRNGMRKLDASWILLISCVGSMVIYGVYIVVDANGGIVVHGGNMLKGIVTPLLVLMMLGISLAVERMRNGLNRFLVWLAQYSLYVYLFHTWFSGTVRVLLRRSGITNCWIQTACGIVLGLAGSVMLGIIIKKVPVFRFWFEPLKVISENSTIKKEGK